MEKSTLIGLDAEMPTRRKTSNSRRERLNELTPKMGDAIVRSASNNTKMQKSAEMSDSLLRKRVGRGKSIILQKRSNNKGSDITFDASVDSTNSLGSIFADAF